MGYKERYEEWLSDPYFDEKTKEELKGLAGNEKEIEDRFYMDLEDTGNTVSSTIFAVSSAPEPTA